MKRLMAIGIILLLFGSYIVHSDFYYTLIGTINTYRLTYATGSTPLLVNCEALLQSAITANVPYETFYGKSLMSEQFYNGLSHQTKSDASLREQQIYQVRIINEQVDPDDSRLIYGDFLIYNCKRESVRWFVAIRQIVIYQDKDTWKILNYVEPIYNTWFSKDILSQSYVC